MKTRHQYLKEIHSHYEDLAKKNKTKLNSNAYRKMNRFAVERFWADSPAASLSTYFKFMYYDVSGNMYNRASVLLKRIRK